MPVRYPQLLRDPRARWWRSALGLLLFAATTATAGAAAVVVVLIGLAVVDPSADVLAEDSLGDHPAALLLANNLLLAMMIPAAALAVFVVHRKPVGLLLAVTARLRWGLLLRFLGVALVAVVLFFVASLAVPGDATEGGGDIDVPEAATLIGLLAVIGLTTPLQAAAEEIGFRGYLSQAVAAWWRRPAVGTVTAGAVTSLLFALAHGTQDAALFTDRLAFGVAASWLAWRTGGLEAAIALHVANNVVALTFGALTGAIEDTFTASTLQWPYAALDVTMMVAFCLVTDRLVRRWRVVVERPNELGEATPSDRAALSGPGAVGYPGTRPPAPPPAGGDNPWGMG